MTNGKANGTKQWGVLLARIITPAGVIAILAVVINATTTLDGIKQGIKADCERSAAIERALHAEHTRKLRRFAIIFPNPPNCPK